MLAAAAQLSAWALQWLSCYLLLVALFGLLALSLAAIGVYGVMSLLVSERTQEVGVRLALGAHPSQVLKMLVAQATKLAVLGVSVGVVLSLALMPLLLPWVWHHHYGKVSAAWALASSVTLVRIADSSRILADMSANRRSEASLPVSLQPPATHIASSSRTGLATSPANTGASREPGLLRTRSGGPSRTSSVPADTHPALSKNFAMNSTRAPAPSCGWPASPGSAGSRGPRVGG